MLHAWFVAVVAIVVVVAATVVVAAAVDVVDVVDIEIHFVVYQHYCHL